MSQFNKNEYYGILVDVIQPEKPLPFDCYVLLTGLNRIVKWVKRNEPFPQSKYEKIKTHAIRSIYIKNEDKQAYFSFLNDFLNSKDGQPIAQNIEQQEELPEGIPGPDEFELNAIVSKHKEEQEFADNNQGTTEGAEDQEEASPVAAESGENEEVSEINAGEGEDSQGEQQVENHDNNSADESTEISYEVTAEKQDEFFEKEQEQEDWGGVNVQEDSDDLEVEGLPEEYKEVVDFLKSNIKDLAQELKAENEANEDENELKEIKDVTLRIEEQTQKISGDPDSDDFKKTIEDATEHIKDELIHIKDLNAAEETKENLKKTGETLLNELNQHKNQLEDPETDNEAVTTSLQNKIAEEIAVMKDSSGQEDGKTKVTSTIGQMLEGVEKRLGEKVQLDPQVGCYDQIPGYLKEKLTMEDIQNSENEDVRKFQHQVVKQNMDLKELCQAIENGKTELKKLKDEWLLFHVQAKKNLSGSDIMSAKKIDSHINQFEKVLNEVGSGSETLSQTSQAITNAIGGKDINVDPELLEALGAMSEQEQQRVKQNIRSGTEESKEVATEEDEENDGDLSLGELLEGKTRTSVAGEADSEEVEKLRSENDLLKSQLENANNLVESGNEKIGELQDLLEKSNDYTEKLEAANEESKKIIEDLEERISKSESSEQRFQQSLDDAHKDLRLSKEDLEQKNEEIDDLKVQIQQKDKEVESLKNNEDYEEMVKTKDERIKDLSQRLEQKQQEISETKKELASLRAKLEQQKQSEKNMASKMERMNAEVENHKQRARSMAAKYEMNNNLLKQARKSVDKMTNMVEDLRKDRQKYIRQTNEAMQKFKAMTEKASTLNRQVEANQESLEKLRSDLDQARQREKELEKELHLWKTKAENMKNKLEDLEVDSEEAS